MLLSYSLPRQRTFTFTTKLFCVAFFTCFVFLHFFSQTAFRRRHPSVELVSCCCVYGSGIFVSCLGSGLGFGLGNRVCEAEGSTGVAAFFIVSNRQLVSSLDLPRPRAYSHTTFHPPFPSIIEPRARPRLHARQPPRRRAPLPTRFLPRHTHARMHARILDIA